MPVFHMFHREIPKSAWPSARVQALYDAVGSHARIRIDGALGPEDARAIAAELRRNFRDVTEEQVLEIANALREAARFLCLPSYKHRYELLEAIRENGSFPENELVLIMGGEEIDSWE